MYSIEWLFIVYYFNKQKNNLISSAKMSENLLIFIFVHNPSIPD